MYSVENPLRIFVVSSSISNLERLVQAVFNNTHQFYELYISNCFGKMWNYKNHIFCLNITEDPQLVAPNTNNILLLDDSALPQKEWCEPLDEVYDFRISTWNDNYSQIKELTQQDRFLLLKSYYQKYDRNLPLEMIVQLLELADALEQKPLHNELQYVFHDSLNETVETISHNYSNSPIPLVSIMIPVHNNLHYTQQCLESIWEHTDTPFELVIVNNNSTDGTSEFLETTKAKYQSLSAYCSGVTIIHNKENESFAKANNRSARAAKGDLLLLLNNDTKVTPFWLSEMVKCVIRDGFVGAVGAKLLYEDTTVQHAGVTFGGVEWVEHFLKGSGKDTPYLNQFHEYRSVTAACMLVQKRLYDQIGGLYEEYINAYEDVDFCLKLGELGYKNVVPPTAVVYHFESKTPGRLNREAIAHSTEVFFSRWNNRIPQPEEARYRDAGYVLKSVPVEGGMRKVVDFPEEFSVIANRIMSNFEAGNYAAVIAEITNLFLLHRYRLSEGLFTLLGHSLLKCGYEQKAAYYLSS